MVVGQRSVRVAAGALGVALATLSAPAAVADSAAPADPPGPAVAESAAVSEDVVTSAAAAAVPEGVPHLPSPDNLPPGTTQTAPERRTLGYLRDIWQAVRSEDVTMSDALLLLAQRPMSSVEPGGAAQRAQRISAPQDTDSGVPAAQIPSLPPPG